MYRRLQGRAALGRSSCSRTRYLAIPGQVPANRPDADALPRAPGELLHRSVGRGLSVHHLLAADRSAARHRHAPGSDLERGRDQRTCSARSGRGSARSAGPPARRIRAFSATSWPAGAEPPRDGADAARRRRVATGARAMNVTCYTDAVIQAHLDKAVAHHVATDVSVVIAAKQEAPSIGDVDRPARGVCRRRSSVVVGHSTDGTAEVAARQRRTRARRRRPRQGRGASAGRSRTSARRSPCSSMPTDRTTRRHPAAGRADSRRRGRSRHRVAAAGRLERAARRLRRVLPAGRQLLHHRVHQLAVRLPPERLAERLSRDPDDRARVSSTCARTLTTIEQEMIIKTLRRGFRMAEVPSHEHPAHCMARRTSACGAALRATATRWSSISSSDGRWRSRDDIVNVLGHLGRPRFGRGAACRTAVLRVRRERGAADPPQARSALSGTFDRGVPGARRSRARAGRSSSPCSTSDPAKTLGRWWPGSKERYYAVRRRKARPGRAGGPHSRGEVPHDGMVARACLDGAQPDRAAPRARARTGWRTPSSASSTITRRMRRPRRGPSGFAPCAVRDDRRTRRRRCRPRSPRFATAGWSGSPRRRPAVRSACSSST